MASNPGFAFVVHSILNNNKNAKILSKAKKETDLPAISKQNDSIKLVDIDGKVIPDDKEVRKNKNNKNENQKRIKTTNTIKRNEIGLIYMKKPNIENKEKEKRLTLIATKGVVQLFNIVREKQRVLKNKLEKAGSSESKRLKVLTEFNDNELQELNKVSYDYLKYFYLIKILLNFK